MSFAQDLAAYMEKYDLNASELAQMAEVSPSTISRYLHSSQVPGEDTLRRIAAAIARAGENRRRKALGEYAQNVEENDPTAYMSVIDLPSEAAIYAELLESATGIQVDQHTCVQNIRSLLHLLHVNHNHLARALYVDPSYISRILSENRNPGNLAQFISDIADYLAQYAMDTQRQEELEDFIGSVELSASHRELSDRVRRFIGTRRVRSESALTGFLEKLDDFDLNEFTARIHFDELRIPTAPFQLPTTRLYHGVEEFMQAELDFLRSAVTARSAEDVILYSDMPMEAMSKDGEFVKKWMYGMALLLRRGLHFKLIHDVHRPMNEMIIGLENWIPMYMTGQVAPFYLKEPTGHTFLHFIRSAGSVAIAGEAIAGYHDEGRYVVTRARDDVQYYRRRAEGMLSLALPLMEIYRAEQVQRLHEQLDKLNDIHGSTCYTSTQAPLFALPEDLLEEILHRVSLSSDAKEAIRAQRKATLAWFEDPGAKRRWRMFTTPEPTPGPSGEPCMPRLPFEHFFPEGDLRYTSEEYAKLRLAMETFADTHENFSLIRDHQTGFRNISVVVCAGRYVVVSKCNAPTIHFLIYHPKLVAAFQEYLSQSKE